MKESFERLVKILEQLRGEGGCPWDQEQTIESMKSCVLDEAREVAEAIENGDMENLKEEIGDLMFVLIFIAGIAKEKGHFDIKSSIDGIYDKMIRRHPHIFGDAKAKNAEEATRLFNEAKAKEKASR
ncbi:nucleotide pyrophosphohydrolase [Candidatus Woesearchaeota archaeon CG11_big_fil_rev_8_21_14_0_20_43_8]|nr:MAG: nucleotide pyrophosphohydrolase [Candidatus Woesearchaeota archaeon CG11_big_fil_rev_8_21_14_0_20_43_8]